MILRRTILRRMKLRRMKLKRWLILTAVLLFVLVPGLSAQQSRPISSPCYDPSDPADIRLWDRAAPGAVGADPCRDIPFLQVYRASADRVSADRVSAFLIIPGGGYDKLTDTEEQAPVAEYFARILHVTAFVLHYRLVQPNGTYRYPVPMWDGQRALRVIRANAKAFGIDPRRIGVFGFSAGGHLASTLALHSSIDFDLPCHDAIDQVSARPALLGLGYPVISMDPADVPPSGSYRHLLKGYAGPQLSRLQAFLSGEKNVTSRMPPVFLFESRDDAVISPLNSTLFIHALHRARVPSDTHLFAHGVHGAGLAQGVLGEEAWPVLFHRWLIGQKFLTPFAPGRV